MKPLHKMSMYIAVTREQCISLLVDWNQSSKQLMNGPYTVACDNHTATNTKMCYIYIVGIVGIYGHVCLSVYR